MPIHANVNSKLGLVVLVLEGAVTAHEWAEQVTPLVGSPQYSLMLLTLVDMTAALSSDAPSDLVRQHSQAAKTAIDDKIAGGAKMVLVATQEEFVGLGHMYALLREESPVQVSVFGTLQNADVWLELPDDYASQLTEIVR